MIMIIKLKFSLLNSQPHSLDGIQGGKSSKEKKKSCSEIEHSSNRSESRDSNKLNNKDQTHKPKGRRRLVENASITTHINFVQVILFSSKFKNICDVTYNNVNLLFQREDKKKRLNSILLNLLERMPNKHEPLDVTNILERNRRNRKRPGILNP